MYTFISMFLCLEYLYIHTYDMIIHAACNLWSQNRKHRGRREIKIYILHIQDSNNISSGNVNVNAKPNLNITNTFKQLHADMMKRDAHLQYTPHYRT